MQGKTIKLLVVLLLVNQSIYAVGDKKDKSQSSIYKINRKLEIPGTVALFGGTFLGFKYLRSKPKLEIDEVLSLEQNDIWWFDRPATKQDPEFWREAHHISDFFLNSSVFLPAILGLDKGIRKDWIDVLTLYTETHAINTSFYLLVAGTTLRTRPFNYHPDIPVKYKLDIETRNSFFSGHVSTAASASFFAAKVYSDYHPEIGNKKYWLYTAALIPPSLVGYYRFKAMKHFPTDILTGLAVGAAAGILIPEMHRIKKEDSGFTFIPFAGHVNGLQISYKF